MGGGASLPNHTSVPLCAGHYAAWRAYDWAGEEHLAVAFYAWLGQTPSGPPRPHPASVTQQSVR